MNTVVYLYSNYILIFLYFYDYSDRTIKNIWISLNRENRQFLPEISNHFIIVRQVST